MKLFKIKNRTQMTQKNRMTADKPINQHEKTLMHKDAAGFFCVIARERPVCVFAATEANPLMKVYRNNSGFSNN